MALLYSPSATATVAANTNTIAVAGMDLSPVLQGMTLYLGARGRLTGDGYIVSTVTLNGTTGGTLTTIDPVTNAYNNAGFVIDTRDFNGTAPNYLIAMYTLVLTTLLRLTSPLTNLFSGSRVLALDKDASAAVSRLLYAILGRTWAAVEQRALTYIPTGGATTTIETLGLRSFPDGTTASESIMIDLTTGGVDFLAATTTMVAATTVDLSSGPSLKVAITGSTTIASFGAGKHKLREVRFVDGGAVLTHNATTLKLPTSANITTQAGDTLRAVSDASGNWTVVSYQRANGKPLGGAGAQDATAYAQVANNLSDLPNKTTARNNIGLSTGDSLTLANVGAVTSYFLAGQEFVTVAGGYTMVKTIDGTQIITAGTSDPTTYNSNTTHRWRSKDNVTTFATLSASGLSVNNTVAHAADNAYSFGTPAMRATVVYAATGSINTSDAREKTEVDPLTDAEVSAATDIAHQIGTFRFLQSVIDKGQDARRHVGMTVQQAIAIMEDHGLNPFAYAFICHDTWGAIEPTPAVPEREAIFDENGVLVSPAVPPIAATPGRKAGERYGFRVDQLLLFIARGFDARLAALENPKA